MTKEHKRQPLPAPHCLQDIGAAYLEADGCPVDPLVRPCHALRLRCDLRPDLFKVVKRLSRCVKELSVLAGGSAAGAGRQRHLGGGGSSHCGNGGISFEIVMDRVVSKD